MRKRVLAVLFGTLLIDMIGVGMIFPILPAIFTDASSPYFMLAGYSVDMQYFMAGALTAIFSVMQFIMAPILGELSDVFGRKKLLALGIAGLAGMWEAVIGDVGVALVAVLNSTRALR